MQKLQYAFMRLVVNALYLIMMQGNGYNMRAPFHAWDNFRDEFFSALREEENKEN